MPDRPWDPPGFWWPELPGVRGVRDRQAGGAWLAAKGASFSVILNRPESVADLQPEGAPALGSRGSIVLTSVAGGEVPHRHHTESFNLVEARGGSVVVMQWNGVGPARTRLEPGVHMRAHGDASGPEFARISTWLPTFQERAGLPADTWQAAWLEALAATSQLGPDDDRAIIRDNTVHGYPTQSLLVCLADIGPTHVQMGSVTLDEPAHWHGEECVHHG